MEERHETFNFWRSLLISFLFLGGTGQVWAVDWGECQRTEISKLKPDIVIPACSQIIDSGKASQADLALVHYQRGRGYHKGGDLDRAIADYDRAIELNPSLAEAYHSRGVAHASKGEYDLAFADFNRAADRGDAEAQTNLGFVYEKGRGVPQDYVAAHMWFTLAAAQGFEEAQKARDIVVKLMTHGQIDEARLMAREWLAKRQQ